MADPWIRSCSTVLGRLVENLLPVAARPSRSASRPCDRPLVGRSKRHKPCPDLANPPAQKLPTRKDWLRQLAGVTALENSISRDAQKDGELLSSHQAHVIKIFELFSKFH